MVSRLRRIVCASGLCGCKAVKACGNPLVCGEVVLVAE